jgi:hypothetical protein
VWGADHDADIRWGHALREPWIPLVCNDARTAWIIRMLLTTGVTHDEERFHADPRIVSVLHCHALAILDDRRDRIWRVRSVADANEATLALAEELVRLRRQWAGTARRRAVHRRSGTRLRWQSWSDPSLDDQRHTRRGIRTGGPHGMPPGHNSGL